MSHEAPLMMEIHPAHRSAPSGLWEAAMSVIGGIATRAAPRALASAGSPRGRRISFRAARVGCPCAPSLRLTV